VTYDREADFVEQVVYFPVDSNPRTGQFVRVPAATRKSIPVVVLDTARPLQLRAEGMLRQLVTTRDPANATADLEDLAVAVASATAELSGKPSIANTVDEVLSIGGVGRRLGDSVMTSGEVQFQAEDGSLSALLRSVQPALKLDAAGLLPLSSQGVQRVRC
jgi:hypothetical protein